MRGQPERLRSVRRDSVDPRRESFGLHDLARSRHAMVHQLVRVRGVRPSERGDGGIESVHANLHSRTEASWLRRRRVVLTAGGLAL